MGVPTRLRRAPGDLLTMPPWSRLAAVGCVTLALGCGGGDAGAPSARASASSSASLAAPVSSSLPLEPTGTASAALPDAISGASVPYSGPPVLGEGKLDGDALRAHNRERLKGDTSPVIALTGPDPVALGKRLCEAVVPRRPPGVPVLVKPNIGGFDSIKDPDKSNGDDGVAGRVTNPEFVRGVIQCLKQRGHTKITVADGWGGPHSYWEKLVVVSGFAEMTRQEGVPLVCMCDDGTFDVQGDKPGKPFAVTGMGKTRVPTLLLPKVLAEHLSGGLFVEVPKLKAHRFSVVSLGIKNLQGVVMSSVAAPAHRQKFRMHEELKEYLEGKKAGAEDRALYVRSLDLFAQRIVDVLEVATPDAVLLEGTPAMMGDGFQQMVPVTPSVAIGGTNVVRVDQAGSMFLGAWENDKLARGLMGRKSSPLIEVAAKRLGLDLSSTQIEGEAADLVRAGRPFVFKALAPFSLAGTEGTTGQTPAPKPSGAKVASAAAVGADPIKLDGTLDEVAWSRAKVVEFSTDWKGGATGVTTKVRFLWSPDALFAGFELESLGFNTDTTKPTDRDRPRLYQEDCVELFLAPDSKQRSRYFEIEVGPFGHFLDLSIDRGLKKEDVGWSSGLTVGTRRDVAASRGTIEVRLSAPEIKAALKSGGELGLALYRMEGKADRRYLAWSPTLTDKPNFHVPERFGTLSLE